MPRLRAPSLPQLPALLFATRRAPKLMAYSKDELRKLRNEVPVNLVISEVLQIPAKLSEGYFRFLCPLCREFNTATNPRTNLARCFRCRQNFNPIDLLMIVKRHTFREAVSYLQQLHSRTRRSPARSAESRGS